MRFSRALPLAVLVLLALSACGSNSPVPSSDQAITAACRGYVLSVGDADLAKAKELIASVPYSGDGDDVLNGIQAAAVEAGRGAGLSDKDFALFRAEVEALNRITGSATVDDQGNPTVGIKQVLAFQKAAEAVHKRCY